MWHKGKEFLKNIVKRHGMEIEHDLSTEKTEEIFSLKNPIFSKGKRKKRRSRHAATKKVRRKGLKESVSFGDRTCKENSANREILAGSGNINNRAVTFLQSAVKFSKLIQGQRQFKNKVKGSTTLKILF